MEETEKWSEHRVKLRMEGDRSEHRVRQRMEWIWSETEE